MKIKYFGEDKEARACQAFLEWQTLQFPIYIEHDASILPLGNSGVPKVVIYEKDEIYAIGFFELVKKWREDGRMLI